MYREPVARLPAPVDPKFRASSLPIHVFPSMPHRSQYDFIPSNTVQVHDFDAGRLLDLLPLCFGLFLLCLSLGHAAEVLKQRSEEWL
jgi:hypothetical protein